VNEPRFIRILYGDDDVQVITVEDMAVAAQSWAEYRKTATVRAKRMEGPFHVDTPEGRMEGDVGDYLCGPGAEGEFWPCKASIFESTYEEVVA
jgi:hypothetical protein